MLILTLVIAIKSAKLTYLSLENNALDWESGPLIAELLRDNTSLTFLSLRGNKLAASIFFQKKSFFFEYIYSLELHLLLKVYPKIQI